MNRSVAAFSKAVLFTTVALLSSCDSSSDSNKTDNPSPADTIEAQIGTVSAPLFSPSAGAYASPQNVTIASATGGATIFYSIDGSAPTTSSTQYTTSVTVSGTQTLKAIAVKNGMTTSAVSSASYTISGSSSKSIPWNSSVRYDSLTYGGQTYKTVTIGTQTWMAENLNYEVDSSLCYSNTVDSCRTYGRLYQWASAMKLPASCNIATCASQVQSKHQGVCPNGWHIPSDAEWSTLGAYLGGDSIAGKKLKSTSGWAYGNGTDAFGFRALPAGFRENDGRFRYVGYNPSFWTLSENDADYAWLRRLDSNVDDLYRNKDYKDYGFSVRCLKD